MMSEKGENSYSNILKRISAFGGVQMFNILINIVRGKLVALLLGPEGMGISQLFTSSTNTLQQFSGLGLNLAFVKEVAPNKNNPEKLSHILSVARRLILVTSLAGALICFILSPWLSLCTFGSYDYVYSFMALSATVGLGVSGMAYLSVLQGLGEVKRLSKASLVGGATGLICGVPLYYFYGFKGIVPSLIILSSAIFLFYYISYRKATAGPTTVRFSWKKHNPLVKKLISLGIVLMIGSLASTLITYLINLFIRTTGSVEDVGLFQGANSLTQQYVGVMFSALALDYFPRLSAISHDTKKMREVVNRQAEIIISVITPLILILIATAPIVIRIFLDDKFLAITPLMRWLGLGVLVQAVSFPLGYIFLARENRKAYIWLEIVFSNILWITCSIEFYHLYALTGLGISLAVRASIDVCVTYIVCRRIYDFRYTRKAVGTIVSSLILGIAGFVASFIPGNTSFLILGAVLAASLTFSVLTLRKGLKTEK